MRPISGADTINRRKRVIRVWDDALPRMSMYHASKYPPLTAGARATTQAIFPYSLPHGLAAGSEVIVDEVRGKDCLVHDAQGQTWTVPIMALDLGCLVWQEGQWIAA